SAAIGTHGTMMIQYRDTISILNPNGTTRAILPMAEHDIAAFGSDDTVIVVHNDDGIDKIAAHVIHPDGRRKTTLLWPWPSDTRLTDLSSRGPISLAAVGADGTIAFVPQY